MIVYLLPTSDISNVSPTVCASTDVKHNTAMNTATCDSENPTTWREREGEGGIMNPDTIGTD